MTARLLRLLAAPLLAGLWGAALGIQHLDGDMWFVGRVEATMTDLRTSLRGVRPAPDLVTIVAIDNDVVGRDGGYPVSRATMARIAKAISSAGPKAIGVDILLADKGPEADDQALEQVLRSNPTVIAAAAVFAGSTQLLDSGGGIRSDIPRADSFLLPLQRFADASLIGVVNVTTDQVGVPRSVPMVFSDGQRIELSFPLRLAALAAGAQPSVGPDGVRLGGHFVPTDIGHSLPLAFFGPRATIRTVSAADVLDGTVEPAAFAGRIVIIGAIVTGSGDVFPSPFDPVLPGVEVMATAISHLTNGDGLLRGRAVRLADVGISVLLAMLFVGLLAWRRSAASYAVIAAIAAAWAVGNMMAFAHGIWLSAALPLTAAAPPAILFGAAQLWLDRRRAQHFATQSALLQRVHATGFSRLLADNPSFLAEPVRQDAAIVFIDMTGFTAVSESIGPEAVRELLNGFYRLIDEDAVASGGTITSFAGDGAMLVFGLPQPTDRDALNAARCCIGLARHTREWLVTLDPAIGSLIRFKMGAHFGPVVASRLGGESNQQITAAGDTVNVANRLMDIAATRGADLAVSSKLLEAAGQDCPLVTQGVLSGQIVSRVRGRTRAIPVRVWWDS